MYSFNVCLLAITAVISLSGCTGAWKKEWPKHEVPAIEIPMALPGTEYSQISREWWKDFNDEILNRLVAEALSNNHDLAKAAANVAEATAQSNAARAVMMPRIDAGASASATRRQVEIVGRDINRNTQLVKGGFGIGWEIDLWGRIEQMNEAALAQLASSEHTRNAVALSVSASVVQAYFQMLALESNLRITQDAALNLSKISALEKRRWGASVGTQLAYMQSLAQYTAVKARIPSIEAAVFQTRLALAILIGRTPREMASNLPKSGRLPSLPSLPEEFDAAVLMRRPDIASANQMLAAANADLNVARAELLPRLNLLALVGLIATSSSAISGFPLYADMSVGATSPIYDAGLGASKVDAAIARKDKATAHYRYTVSIAFRDIYAAMKDRESSDRQVDAASEALRIRRQTLDLTERSYSAGRSSKFEVLSETMDVLEAQTALTDARLNQFIASSEFYKAIGGGF